MGRPVMALTARALAPAALALAVLAPALAGCGGTTGTKTAVSAATTSTPGVISNSTPTSSPTPTLAPGQLPTVSDCGGGAYRPPTLLIVCGVDTTMATGVTWKSWTTTGASGTGLVHLKVAGRDVAAWARLDLSDIQASTSGPQFSHLEITWTGARPDGKSTDAFPLSVAS